MSKFQMFIWHMKCFFLFWHSCMRSQSVRMSVALVSWYKLGRIQKKFLEIKIFLEKEKVPVQKYFFVISIHLCTSQDGQGPGVICTGARKFEIYQKGNDWILKIYEWSNLRQIIGINKGFLYQIKFGMGSKALFESARRERPSRSSSMSFSKRKKLLIQNNEKDFGKNQGFEKLLSQKIYFRTAYEISIWSDYFL